MLGGGCAEPAGTPGCCVPSPEPSCEQVPVPMGWVGFPWTRRCGKVLRTFAIFTIVKVHVSMHIQHRDRPARHPRPTRQASPMLPAPPFLWVCLPWAPRTHAPTLRLASRAWLPAWHRTSRAHPVCVEFRNCVPPLAASASDRRVSVVSSNAVNRVCLALGPLFSVVWGTGLS